MKKIIKPLFALAIIGALTSCAQTPELVYEVGFASIQGRIEGINRGIFDKVNNYQPAFDFDYVTFTYSENYSYYKSSKDFDYYKGNLTTSFDFKNFKMYYSFVNADEYCGNTYEQTIVNTTFVDEKEGLVIVHEGENVNTYSVIMSWDDINNEAKACEVSTDAYLRSYFEFAYYQSYEIKGGSFIETIGQFDTQSEFFYYINHYLENPDVSYKIGEKTTNLSVSEQPTYIKNDSNNGFIGYYEANFDLTFDGSIISNFSSHQSEKGTYVVTKDADYITDYKYEWTIELTSSYESNIETYDVSLMPCVPTIL